MPQLPPINKSGLFSNKTFSINEVVTSQSMEAIASEIKKHGGLSLIILLLNSTL